jgi:hypothetical protein
MDWAREEDVLEKILALLVALAGLADRAAGLPLARQLAVLGFLAQAEAAARSFVVGSGASAAVAGSRAADRAERLSADFRALALMLCAAMARARRLAGPFSCVAPPASPSRDRPIVKRRHHAQAPTAPDTS